MRQRLTALMLAIVLCCSTVVETVSAVTVDEPFYDENFYSLNNIGWYDPRCVEATSAEYVQLAGNDNTEKILNFFMRKGLTLAQAAGIVGNMMQESGLNPAIEEGGRIVDDTYKLKPGVGFGLVQWTPPNRQVNLTNFINELGVGITDLSGQLEFTWKEMNDSYSHVVRALKQADKADVAAVIVHGRADVDSSNPVYREGMRLIDNRRGYEISGDTGDEVIQNRGNTANAVYTKYADAPALAGATADSSMTPSGEGSEQLAAASGEAATPKQKECIEDDGTAASGDLATLTKAYAWPEFINPGTSKQIDGKSIKATDQQPKYATAVANAVRDQRYVGGANGNDCGGFITTLMYDSGFDKNYNYANEKSKMGNTITQEKWLKEHWQPLSAEDAKDASKRQPGDVAINEDHTYLYVGDIGADFKSKIASASYSDRAPMAGSEGVVDGSFRWYRKK